MKPMYDTSPPNRISSADAVGRNIFKDFINPLPNLGCVGLTVVMDSIICQQDPVFKDLLNAMHSANMTRDLTDVLLARRLSNLSPQERAEFERDALYVMPLWKCTVPITKNYL